MPADPQARPVRWPPDRLRAPFAPRQTPRAAPAAGVFDPPYRCVLVNAAWVSHLAGVVDVLTEADAWAGADPARAAAIQQVEAFLRALTLGNCAMGITGIRVNGCTLEVEYDDSGTWTEVGDLTSCVVPGPPGQDGASVELRYRDKGGGDWWVQWRQDDDDPTWADLFPVPEGGLPGPPGADGASVELRVSAGWIQWRQDDDDPTWTNLFPVPQDGAPGAPGEDGADGASVELQVWAYTEVGMPHYGETWLQWRRVGDAAWQNLIDLADLQGDPGADGASVELQVWAYTEVGMPHYGETWVQWRRVGDAAWQNLVDLADLQGDPGEDGASVELQVWAYTEVGMPHYGETWLQWRRVGDAEWQNLVDLADLKGDPGADGAPGPPGADGASAELRVHEYADPEGPQYGQRWIQWRQDDDNPTWTDLVSLAALVGPQGRPGLDGVDGLPGAPGAPGECIPYPGDAAQGGDVDQEWCGAATYLTDFLDGLLSDVLARIAAGSSVAAFLQDLLAATVVAIPVVAAIKASWDAIAMKYALIDAEADSTFWGQVKCALYAAQPTGNAFSATTLEAWQTQILSLPNAPNAAPEVAGMLDWLTLGEWQRKAWIGSLAPSALCAAECPGEDVPEVCVVKTLAWATAPIGVTYVGDNYWDITLVQDQVSGCTFYIGGVDACGGMSGPGFRVDGGVSPVLQASPCANSGRPGRYWRLGESNWTWFYDTADLSALPCMWRLLFWSNTPGTFRVRLVPC